MKFGSIIMIFLILISVSTLPSVHSENENSERNPPAIKIGFLNDATGPISVYAAPFAAAAEIALTEINSNQNYYVFEIVYADSACDGTTAATAAQALVDAGVVGVVGAACSGASMGANSVLSAAGIPHISYASSSPALSDDTAYPDFFRVVPSDALQGQALSAVVKADMPADGTVGLIHMTNDYGSGLADSFTAAFTADNSTLCQILGYEQIATDFSAAVQAMIDNGCTSAVLVSYAADGGMIIDDMAAMGWSGQVYGGDGLCDTWLAADMSSSVDGVTCTVPRIGMQTSVSLEFISTCLNNSDCASGIYTAEAYDAMMIMFESYIQSAGGNQLNQQILITGQYWEGASGWITFDSNGDSAGAGFDICEFDESNGQVSLNCYDTWGGTDPPQDSDNDGWLDNVEVQCSTNPNDNNSIPEDWDLDGICNLMDNDNDNDGWTDEEENLCLTGPFNENSIPLDYDNDGICDIIDEDDDNDGYDDENDWASLDSLEWLDTDGDGLGDNEDNDDDGDGYTDYDELFCISDPYNSTSIPNDYDDDGVCDNLDSDDDNDGYSDEEDSCPYNFFDWNDYDGDGICDNLDLDDDGDGYNDLVDAFPLISWEWIDTDDDGTGDNSDSDDDDDGWDDYIESQCDTDSLDFNSIPLDTDGDLTCNKFDDDDDGDGFNDTSDIFPLDYTEWNDNDEDGIGDNSDDDDDDDGTPDSIDAFPLDSTEQSDTDGDGIGDNSDTDDDGDYIEDIDDFCPRGDTGWISGAALGTDYDGDGCRDDGEDIDDDGDGVEDIFDSCPRGHLGWLSNQINDIDADGCYDSVELFPNDPSNGDSNDGEDIFRNEKSDDRDLITIFLIGTLLTVIILNVIHIKNKK